MSQVLSVSFLWFIVFWLCGLLFLRRLVYFRPLFYVVLPFVYISVLRSFSVISFTNDMIGTISLLHFLPVVHYEWLYNLNARYSLFETAYRFCCCLFAWESSLWPFHVSWSFYAFPTPPTRWVVCPLNIFSKLRMLIIVKSAARRVGLGPAHRQCSTYFKRGWDIICGPAQDRPLRAAEDGVAIFKNFSVPCGIIVQTL